MYKITISIIAELIVFFFLGCSSGEKTYTEEIINGVRVVHNNAPLWGDEKKISLEFVQKIGELESEDENYLLYYPIDITRDNEGFLYILDKDGRNIKKYTADGEYVAAFGGEGQGPGEFEMPYFIEVANNGDIWISDASGRMQVLSPEGKYKREIRLKPGSTSFALFENGNILNSNLSFDMQEDFTIVKILNKDGELINEFGEPVRYNDIVNNFSGNNNKFFVDSRENVIIVYSYREDIEKYSAEGELIFRIIRDLNYNLEIKEVTDDRGRTRTRFTSISRNAGVDHKDRIWDLIWKRQLEEGEEFDRDNLDKYWEFNIYSREGILLTKLPPPGHLFDTIQHIGDRLYFIDPHKDACIYEYRIVEK
ncbi:6-bladed beta-propeller [candidate division KSB1 bacterium]